MGSRGAPPPPPPPDADVCNSMAYRVTPPYSSQLRARAAWGRVSRAALAAPPSGGGWRADFDPTTDLTPARVAALAELIDRELLGGRAAALAARPGAPLAYDVEEEKRGEPSVTATYSAAANRITVYRAPFRREVSYARPIQIDGAYTFTRLDWLAHTLGHEMIHAIVETACPSAAASPAMAAAAGHGPLFTRLNRHWLGHTAASRYFHGWRRDGRRYVRPAAG